MNTIIFNIIVISTQKNWNHDEIEDNIFIENRKQYSVNAIKK